MKWGEDGAVSKDPKAVTIKNGAYSALTADDTAASYCSVIAEMKCVQKVRLI